MSTIAVVDHDPLFLDLLHEVLADEGYQTHLCLDSSAAHAMIRHNQPHAIILDVGLQQLDRWCILLEGLRCDPLTAHIPVITCSANERFLEEKEAWLNANCYGILHKPFSLSDLLEMVQRALDAALPSREPPVNSCL